MDPLQFVYRDNRSTDDAIAHLLHTMLTHLDIGRGNYVKMLFVDYSSAFNTIIPSLLTTKLEDLGLHTSLFDWISNFLTDRPQSVQVGNCASSTLTLSTGAPQGCVLSPLLYLLYTYNCTATSSSTIFVKFADDTVVMGLILYNNERAYLEEIKHLESWCQENNLLLNVSKTKELIEDCSKKQERHYQPMRISGTMVERVDSFRTQGVEDRAMEYEKYVIANGKEDLLPLAFNDTMGVEKEQGVHTDDIISALRGHIKEGYVFNPKYQISEENPHYLKNPSLSDRIHCLVSVVAADRIAVMDQEIINKMRQVRQAANRMGIPQVVFMTRVDLACPLTKENLRYIYKSKKVRDNLQKCSSLLGIPVNCIFPVKNYHMETHVFVLKIITCPVLIQWL
ncbi:hypothetical protein P4O66_000862 [Electrophorus voltai]|uniref:Reverse transcriptase domain-containing protein n=1 Tax=Electrophorus voltai TaxID=2609070 RepID=A0AAD8ZEH4_9TELE|nr:hypothetical protein P4O66_000862 [Electrophorus voltai]